MAMSAEYSRSKTKKQELRSFTNQKVSALQDGLLKGRSSSRATAARLRRAIDQPAGSVPEIWNETLGGMPPELIGRTDEPSYAETSAHTALALYAIHQQSRASAMHQRDWGLGNAVRTMMARDSGADYENSPIIRRFNAVATADSVEELSAHLRGLVSQLRANDIPLDYSALVGEIFDFHFPESIDQVRRRWGRQLYAAEKQHPRATSPASESDK